MTKIIGFLLIVIAGGLLAYSAAQHFKQDAKIQARRDTIHVTDSVAVVRTESVTVKLAAKSRTDTLVQIVTDTQLVVRESPDAKPETVTVRAPIVEHFRSDSALILSLFQRDTTRVKQIADRDSLIRLLKPPSRWGLAAGVGYVCNKSCGLGVGLMFSYRIR